MMTFNTIDAKLQNLEARTADVGRGYRTLISRMRDALRESNLLLVDLYYTAHREGWEPGQSTEEACNKAHSYLCNQGLDPYANGGPEAIAKLRADVTLNEKCDRCGAWIRTDEVIKSRDETERLCGNCGGPV